MQQNLRLNTLAVVMGLLGATAGIAVGLLLGRSPQLEWAIEPILRLLRPIPPLAWIPPAIVWFGISQAAAFIIAIVAFWISHLWEATRKTVVFVTHDVEEAVYLADRVLVLTARPGRVRALVEVDLPRPRDRLRPAFAAVERELLELVSAGRPAVNAGVKIPKSAEIIFPTPRRA